jgi:uncharacterized repeat protein (TIGR01451 family)
VGDSLLPPGNQVAFRGNTASLAVIRGDLRRCNADLSLAWRLFAYPRRGAALATRATLMSRLVGWLSWLGRSELQAGRTVAQLGDHVPYTLTLRNDGPGIVVGASVSNTLPANTALVDGPHGGASYDPALRRITWSGDLGPGAAVTFTYRVSLLSGTAHNAIHSTADVSLGEQGFQFRRQANLRIAAPDLSASYLTVSPGSAAPTRATAGSSSMVTIILVVRNDGLDDALVASVDNPLPWPLRLITGTLSSGGVGTPTELPTENRILWQGKVAVGVPVTLTYRAIAPSVLEQGIWLYNAARLEDGLGGLGARGVALRRAAPLVLSHRCQEW